MLTPEAKYIGGWPCIKTQGNGRCGKCVACHASRLQASEERLLKACEAMLSEYTTTCHEAVCKLRQLGEQVDSAEKMRAAFCRTTGCEEAIAQAKGTS